jgi:hypothetical protein
MLPAAEPRRQMWTDEAHEHPRRDESSHARAQDIDAVEQADRPSGPPHSGHHSAHEEWQRYPHQRGGQQEAQEVDDARPPRHGQPQLAVREEHHVRDGVLGETLPGRPLRDAVVARLAAGSVGRRGGSDAGGEYRHGQERPTNGPSAQTTHALSARRARLRRRPTRPAGLVFFPFGSGLYRRWAGRLYSAP